MRKGIQNDGRPALWITVKNGASIASKNELEVKLDSNYRSQKLSCTALMSGARKEINIPKSGRLQLNAELKPEGSEVYFIEQAHD